MYIRYTRIRHVESHIYIQTQMRCLDACVEVCYCARMGSIWSAHTRISLPFLAVRIRMTYESMLCCNARKVLWEMQRKVSARPWLTLLVSEEKVVQAMSSCPQQSSGKSWIGPRSKVSKLMKSWNLYLMIIVDFLVFFTCTYFSKEWDFMSLRTAHAIGCTQQHRASRSKPFLRVP